MGHVVLLQAPNEGSPRACTAVQTVTAVTVNRKPVRCFLADSEADTALLNLSTRSDREGEW